jgi:Na+/H+-translocating membrane pyrophosphatase
MYKSNAVLIILLIITIALFTVGDNHALAMLVGAATSMMAGRNVGKYGSLFE